MGGLAIRFRNGLNSASVFNANNFDHHLACEGATLELPSHDGQVEADDKGIPAPVFVVIFHDFPVG